MKMKILFIANNIPAPKLKNNRIILTIAGKLATQCDISFVYPAFFIFPPFSFMRKYKALANLKPWKDGDFLIKPAHYIRLPWKRWSYWLMNTIRPQRFIDQQNMPNLCHAHYIMPDGYFAYRV
ncbi:MAG: hypothetical protein LBV39_07310, partial [Bacteroidales bacterium]|nr:hypothetical protein [Bacteroidales bacterium]